MTDTAPAAPKRPMGRSPSYPAIDLERAIHRAHELYDKDKQHPTPVVNAVRHWGYRGINGPASLTVAALKKYGLVEDDGAKADRTIRVTNLAVKIFSHPEPKVRQQAIEEAALKPAIHAEMWAQHGADLPSDDTLMWTLTREMNFTESGAREFLREYKHTVSFARLDELDDQPEPVTTSAGDVREAARPSAESATRTSPYAAGNFEDIFGNMFRPAAPSATAAPEEPRVMSYPVPVARSGKPPVVLSGAFPLSPSEWKQFMAYLKAMKPVLADVDEDETIDAAEDN